MVRRGLAFDFREPPIALLRPGAPADTDTCLLGGRKKWPGNLSPGHGKQAVCAVGYLLEAAQLVNEPLVAPLIRPAFRNVVR